MRAARRWGRHYLGLIVASSDSGSDYRAAVLATTDIVELIGRTVSLKRRGKDFLGLCPFHSEKTPSFTVKPDRQYFYCFGCKEHGNAIDFVIKRDRVEFIDALKMLGEAAGIAMPQFGGSKEKTSEKKLLLEANSAACMFFEKLLADPDRGRAAREYLVKRGINDESVQKFRIGYAPDAWDGLLRSGAMRKFPPPQMHAAGLVKARDNGGGHYDVFRNRLMFPIRDETGRVIAFGGRVMPGSQDPAKYLNSPETPLFLKGKSVFGLDLARQRIVETRTVVVVEGYTDVVMAHQFGATNVVSILGTAMTEPHVNLLRRFADRIILLFDADLAGENAVDKAVSLFLTQPIEIGIATIDSGLDPDEYLLKEGLASFEKLIAEAPDALTYKWKGLVRRLNEAGADDLTARQRAVSEYLELLASARGSGPVDALRWGAALSRVSRLTEIPVEELNRRFKANRPGPIKAPVKKNEPNQQDSPSADVNQAPAAPRVGAGDARERAERWILGALLLNPPKWAQVQEIISVADFVGDECRRLAELYWRHQRDEGEPVFNEFLGLLSRDAHPDQGGADGNDLPANRLAELAIEAADEVEALPDPEATLAEAVRFLVRCREELERQKLVAQFRRTNEGRSEQDEVDQLRALQEKARRPDLRRA